jgi:stage II sporulation protein M
VLFGTEADLGKRVLPLFGLSMFMFMFAIGVGYYLGDSLPEDFLIDILAQIPEPSDNFAVLIYRIVSNNVLVSAMLIISGIIFGLPPLLLILYNGFIVGWISFLAASEMGIWYTLMSLLPHGIIEIPTINFCAALGLGLGYELVNSFRKRGNVREYLINTVKLLLKRIIPFLVIAAIVESALISLLLNSL